MPNRVAEVGDEARAASQQAEAPQISMIGADIVITGNIDASVDLQIEGRVNGDVQCATLILGPDSAIEGNIRAERVRVSGSVRGSIETGDLAIEATASVSGDVTYERLRIANGGTIEGTLRRSAPAEEMSEASKLKLVQQNEAGSPSPSIYIE